MFRRERSTATRDASIRHEQEPSALLLPMETGIEKLSVNVTIHASGDNEDNSWKYEGRKRQVTGSMLPRLSRGIQRLLNFEHKATNKIIKRGVVATGLGAALVWSASAIGISSTIPLIVVGATVVATVYTVGRVSLRIWRGIERHRQRVYETTRDRLDEINRDMNNSR